MEHAKAGDIAGALHQLQSIKVPRLHAYTLTHIAEAQWRAGRADDASATLDQAMQMARSIKAGEGYFSTFVVEGLITISALQWKIGRAAEATSTLAEAMRVAHSAVELDWRPEALSSIAEAQFKAGRAKEATATLEQALQVARSFGGGRRAGGLTVVAKAQTKTGLTKEATATFRDALSTARSLPVGFDQDYALNEIVTALITDFQ